MINTQQIQRRPINRYGGPIVIEQVHSVIEQVKLVAATSIMRSPINNRPYLRTREYNL